MPWIVRLIPNNDTSLYNAKCATCHKTDRTGTRGRAVAHRHRPAQDPRPAHRHRSATAPGACPGYPDLGAKNTNDLVDFLITGKDRAPTRNCTKEPTYVKYRSDGETLWRDPDGYPPLTPPWGTLNAIDLNAGTIRGRFRSASTRSSSPKGLRNTGSDNYGGPVVTASGLLFIGATNFDRKFHAYDKLTGKLLWETTLPAAGNATPSIYSIDGREYIVIACGGGKNGAPSGSTYRRVRDEVDFGQLTASGARLICRSSLPGVCRWSDDCSRPLWRVCLPSQFTRDRRARTWPSGITGNA